MWSSKETGDDPMTPTTKFKTRTEATESLREKGVPIGKTTLAELAAEDRGPRYAVINGRALYTEHDLMAWLEEQAKQSPHQASQRGRARAAAA
jgi:hypothetical protein